MLLKGILQKDKDNKWIIWKEDGNEYWYPHPDHNMWLKMFGEENTEVCFVIDDSNTAYYNIAILKACGPDTHEYIQD